VNLKTSLALVVLVCATATASAQAPATPAAPTHAGFVKNLRGDVKLLDANGVMRPARTGDEVSPVERVVTGPDSPHGGLMRLWKTAMRACLSLFA